MFTEIIPLNNLPRNLSFFDYRVPTELEAELKVGQIVVIPWRNQKIHGLVSKIKASTDIPEKRTKNISAILNFSFTPEELEFILKISQDHFVSASVILNDFWQPAPLKIHNTTFDWQTFYDFKGAAGVSTVCQCPVGAYRHTPLHVISKNVSSQTPAAPANTLLLNNQRAYKQKRYQEIIQENLQNHKQTLILFPSVQTMIDFAKTIDTEQCLMISHKLSSKKNLNYRCWQAILNQEKLIILGTRSALFYPWRNLQEIIVDQSEHPDYKQDDQNPRYHGVDLALDLAKILHIKITLECLCPRLKDYYQASQADKKNWQIINHWESIEAKQTWVDLNNTIKNHPLLSETLEEQVQNAYEKGKNILILHNRKHFSAELYCPNCKEILNCPKCQVPYVYDQKAKRIYCENCGQDLAEHRCPHCQQRDYQFKHFGLENLSEYWQEKYPQTTVISIANKNSSEKDENLLRESLLKKTGPKIVFATNYIFSLVPKNYFQLIALTQSDQLLNIADFNSQWRLFSQLAQLIQHCAEEKIDLCLQSRQSQHFVMQALRQYNYPLFYQNELKVRKKYDYPPYQELIKLIYQNDNKSAGEKIIGETQNTLQNLLGDNGQSSWQAMHKQIIQTKTRTRWRWLLWFKVKADFWQTSTELKTFINNLDENFLIDINPENLYR